MSLNLEAARTIVAAARAHGAEAGFNPLTVVVLDAGAHLLAAEREDGSAIKRFEIAHGKAHGALALGMGSRAIMARAEQQAYFVAAATAAIGGALVPVPGGVLVTDDSGAIIGAVGISGDSSDNDEAACLAGIKGRRPHGGDRLTPFPRCCCVCHPLECGARGVVRSGRPLVAWGACALSRRPRSSLRAVVGTMWTQRAAQVWVLR